MLKIESDLKDNKNPQIAVIANHLIENSKDDSLIRESVNKENKSLDEMFKYIKSEVRKKAVDGVAMIEDAEVYGIAQHYYDEDSITMKDKNKVKETETLVNLPEEDLGAFDI